ncbi:16S rRNA (cytidine(1402)-2'-O)-methyltransferase [Alkalibacterium kapii]|uniref:Ribosomal RNA small subunit methyltransferase I n=1 Tax=Alkalibacterium kapii TaxID=426704 RepID=A0A511AV43_9LACT|nr:16S rRNA (cytidine(1402)-2'-O)-methyltransferase [Alkalibacterium kapii]GEK92024.1 ribosomal RNA small subunit methyltransferase I [Alkalibacterium kapii]
MINTQKSFEHKEEGNLYLVPTPIGNLDDMTFRAVDLLKHVDLIASEDTRNTQKLLNHFEIESPQISFHEHNSKERTPQLIEKLKAGKSIAQVSDAGMPSISDPGVDLVKAAIDEGITVVPLPGANAALTALIASGLTPQPFYFLGFLPRKKKELNAKLTELNKREETLVFYESPHRIKQVVVAMKEVFGEKRQIVLAREVTKRFEEFIRGTIKEVLEWLNNEKIRGEFVVIVEGNENSETEEKAWANWTLKEHVEFVMENNDLSSKKAIKEVALIRNLPKRSVYAAYHGLDD